MNKMQDNLLKLELKKECLHITEIAKMFPSVDVKDILNHLENSKDFTSSFGGVSGNFYSLSWTYLVSEFYKNHPRKKDDEVYYLFMREYERFPMDFEGFVGIKNGFLSLKV